MNSVLQQGRELRLSCNLYGLLMMRGDLDILEEVMDCNQGFFRAIFVLDGTEDWKQSEKILSKYSSIEFYVRDSDLPQEYERPPRDGARQVLLVALQAKYEFDGYAVVLHSDEMYFDVSPHAIVQFMEKKGIDSVAVRNVPFFLHSSLRGSYRYDSQRPVVEQVQFAAFPGWPEQRVFKNKPGLQYNVSEHARTMPHGLGPSVLTDFPIRHYLYRSEDQMRDTAEDRVKRKWQSFGANWMAAQGGCFTDCLEGYQFAKRVRPGKKIVNGSTGELI